MDSPIASHASHLAESAGYFRDHWTGCRYSAFVVNVQWFHDPLPPDAKGMEMAQSALPSYLGKSSWQFLTSPASCMCILQTGHLSWCCVLHVIATME